MLSPITERIYEVISEITAPGGIHFPLRMTVLKLTGGGLLLHSPVAFDDATAAQIDALGPVRFIVAPNLFHHIHVGKAARRYPDATVLVAPGLEKKRSNLPPHTLFTDDLADPFGGEISWKVIDGCPQLNEVVMVHHPTKTLITGDLIFNLHEAHDAWTKLVYRMVGVWQKPAQSRMVRMATQDRAAAGAAVRHVLGWDFDRITVTHGHVVEGDGKRILEQGAAWMLGG